MTPLIEGGAQVYYRMEVGRRDRWLIEMLSGGTDWTTPRTLEMPPAAIETPSQLRWGAG